MDPGRALEGVLRRDRLVAGSGLAVVVVLAWGYLLAGAGMPAGMAALAEPMAWTAGYALLMFAMWWIMMVAMMVPSAAPTVLLFTAIRRGQDGASSAAAGAAVFLAGYLALWAAFSLAATIAQWGLERAGLAAMGETRSATLAGLLVLAAGLYQFSPVKSACLRHCQGPLLFLGGHWRPGLAGAFRMGATHGAYCVGCCWFLMALLFVGGVMNILWVGAIAAYVALEKLAGLGAWPSRITGGALVLLGALMLVDTGR